MRLSGFELSLYDSVDKRLMNVFIIDPDNINPDYLHTLAQKIESVRLDAIQAKSGVIGLNLSIYGVCISIW